MLTVLRRLVPAATPSIEIELTGQLFGGRSAIGIVGGVSGAIGIQAVRNSDPVPAVFLLSLAMVSSARIVAMLRFHARYGTRLPNLESARHYERSYAIGSFAISLLLGTANLFALSYRDPPLALLAMSTLSCYVFFLILRTAFGRSCASPVWQHLVADPCRFAAVSE